MTTIKDTVRKARKTHHCSLCNDLINKGDSYVYQYVKAGEAYELHQHIQCSFLLEELWYFMADFEGVNIEQYKDGLEAFSRNFVCPNCKEFSQYGESECAYAFRYCYRKVMHTLKRYEPVKIGKTGHKFMLLKRQNPIIEHRGISI